MVPVALQRAVARSEITKSLHTLDRTLAARRLTLWESHIGTYFAKIRGRAMTPEQLDELTRRYLATTFDEIEEHLALEWEQPGLDGTVL